MNTGPFGSELTREPFRWDQRLFGIVLALPAQASSNAQSGLGGTTVGVGVNDTPANQFIPPAMDQPITAMCDVTGGEFSLRHSQDSVLIRAMFRSFVSHHVTTIAQPMFRITCTKNSTWCGGELGEGHHRRYVDESNARASFSFVCSGHGAMSLAFVSKNDPNSTHVSEDGVLLADS